MVTVEPNADTERQASIAAEIAGDLGEASVKDSYAALPLAAYGFAELFAAQWLWAAPGSLSGEENDVRYQRIADPSAIAHWIEAWEQADGAADNLVEEVALISGVEFWGSHTLTGLLQGGLIAFRSTGVVGITNMFGAIAGLPAAASSGGRETVCCFEHGSGLSRAVDQGFEAIGPLKVWTFGEG